jgi:hypothetical protein
VQATQPLDKKAVSFIAKAPNGDILLESGNFTMDSVGLHIWKADNTFELLSESISEPLKEDGLVRSYFLNNNQLLTHNCVTKSRTSQTCTVNSIDIYTGVKMQLLTMLLQDTGNDLPMKVLGVFDNGNRIVFTIQGAGKDVDPEQKYTNGGIFSFDVTSRTFTKSVALKSYQSTIALSPDGKKAMYIMGGNSSTEYMTLHLLDTNSGDVKDLTTKYKQGSVISLLWSPDSTKVVYIIDAFADNEATLSYWDISKTTSTDVMTITNSRFKRILKANWLNDNSLLYETSVTSKANDFSNSDAEMSVYSIDSKTSTALTSTPRTLTIDVY